MSYHRQGRTRRPTHPGRVVRMELEELGMTVKEAAQRLGVSRPGLSALVNERRSVSALMALKLGRFFGNGTDLWLNVQSRYDGWQVEHDREALREADRVEPLRV